MRTCFYDGISLQNQRAVNMDALLLKERVLGETKIYIAVVCDGVGSMRDGAYAAVTIVKLLSEWFDQLESTRRIGLQLRDKMREINRTIYLTAQSRCLQTAATASALLLSQDQYFIAHTGDSRIYSWQDGILLALTQDQVSESGKLTACLGRWPEAQLFYNEGLLRESLFLLCSDGLYKRMDGDYLCQELQRTGRKHLRKTMEHLAQYVIARGEADNISLALLKCEG